MSDEVPNQGSSRRRQAATTEADAMKCAQLYFDVVVQTHLLVSMLPPEGKKDRLDYNRTSPAEPDSFWNNRALSPCGVQRVNNLLCCLLEGTFGDVLSGSPNHQHPPTGSIRAYCKPQNR